MLRAEPIFLGLCAQPKVLSIYTWDVASTIMAELNIAVRCLSLFFGRCRQMATSPALRVIALANDRVTHPRDAGREGGKVAEDGAERAEGEDVEVAK